MERSLGPAPRAEFGAGGTRWAAVSGAGYGEGVEVEMGFGGDGECEG